MRTTNYPRTRHNAVSEQACARWVEQHVLRSAKARANERSYLRQLVRTLGKKKLKAVTLDDLKDYQSKRSETVQARPINLELGILAQGAQAGKPLEAITQRALSSASRNRMEK